jgi:hypothetical protein
VGGLVLEEHRKKSILVLHFIFRSLQYFTTFCKPLIVKDAIAKSSESSSFGIVCLPEIAWLRAGIWKLRGARRRLENDR